MASDGLSPEALIMKGKQEAAATLQALPDPTEALTSLLVVLLDPQKPIDMWDTIDWCSWLMAAGRTPPEFAATVSNYNNATACGFVWNANFVAYRCRTCGLSPCMSVCADCFRLGDHEGHDFNMFRSQAGGACDCGDGDVMKSSGFCSRHGQHKQNTESTPPPELLKIAKVMMPRVIARLVLYLRETSDNTVMTETTLLLNRADVFIDFLENLSAMGAAMKQVMTTTLSNPTFYQDLMSAPDERYDKAKADLKNWDWDSDTDIKAFRSELIHETFLDELIFWMVKYEFPQKLTCVMLNMLTDADYKIHFTRSFITHYPRISLLLTQCEDSESISNRVVHVSVQLFSNEGLCLQMVKECQLLHVMVISMKAMMRKTLQQSTLQDPDKNLHYVINCGHKITKQHCSWPLISDLNNILTHQRMIVEFLSDVRLLDLWFNFLTMFQGMNVHHRETGLHVEYESTTYYTAFSAELEGCATPMWELLLHLHDRETLPLTISVLKQCALALENFFDAINFHPNDQPALDQVTFHLPLHRYFAVFLRNCVLYQNCSIQKAFAMAELKDSFLQCIMAHPLQTLVSFYEIIAANMWVRNGLQIKGQAMTYIQSHFCNSMVDPDIYLLQICASQLDSNQLLSTIIERFRVSPVLFIHSAQSEDSGEEKVYAMFNSLLTFIATLVSVRSMLCSVEEECIRDEMVSMLCMSNRTHSKLIDLLPDKCAQLTVNMVDVERYMKEVADYKAPNFEMGGHMRQGTYTPKPVVWQTLFDPIHTLLRSVHRRDYQSALDRFAAHTGVKNCWPPYRIPQNTNDIAEDPRKLLLCSSLYGMLFVVFQKALTGQEIDEEVLSLAVYLMEMTVEFHSKATCAVCAAADGPLVSSGETLEIDEVCDGERHFKNWFPNSCPIIASLTQIKNIDLALSDNACERRDVDLERTASTMDLDVNECNDFPRLPRLRLGCLDPASLISEGPGPSGTYDTTPTNVEEDVSQFALVVRHSSEIILAQNDRAVGCAMETDDCDLDLEEDATMASLPAPVPQQHLLAVNESIISLLLKLHAKLVTKSAKDAPTARETKRTIYKTPQEEGHVSVASCRIGDGVHFIGILLDRFCLSHSSVEARIRRIRDSIWPTESSEPKTSKSESHCREERRRRAKERQQKLMQEFANRQKSFMQQCTEMADEEQSDAKPEEERTHTTVSGVPEYECVICSQISPSTTAKPVGVVVLLQATSVTGHARPYDEPELHLPCNDEDTLPPDTTRAKYARQCYDELTRHFDASSWFRSMNIGWEGGVYVQTCGHYIHLDCHKSYLLSQKNQRQDPNRAQLTIAPDRNEYQCPLCRQLANSVLPIHPIIDRNRAVVQCNPRSHKNVASELAAMMATVPTPSSDIIKEMTGFMEDLSNTTFVQYRTLVYLKSMHPMSLFVCSLARTNLEIDLLHRGGHLLPPSSHATIPASSATTAPRKSCFFPLFEVLALHLKVYWDSPIPSKALTDSPLSPVWHSLTGIKMESTMSVTPVNKKIVPLLIKDPSAVLIELMLSLPLSLDKVYFTCLVRVLYSLTVTQGLCRATTKMSSDERAALRKRLDDDKSTPFGAIVAIIMECFESLSFHSHEDDERGMYGQVFDSYMEQSVLPFLRISALLQMELFSEQLPARSDDGEFVMLCKFLSLQPTEHTATTSAFSYTPFSAVQWVENPITVVTSWCAELREFIKMSRSAALSLMVDQPIKWRLPYLLKLPKSYSTLFEYYLRKQCGVCHSHPADPAVCLACGKLICLRETCCRRQDSQMFEAVQHSIECGAGTAIILAINSTSIVVIRDKRACLWGSLYLDSFGEEDRDLKRGKPLYLSEERYALLQHQWLTHSFDHCAHKRWVWHKNNI